MNHTKMLMVALCAIFSLCAQAQVYEKVKSAPADWSGEYLIVKEVDSIQTGIVMDGSLTDLLNKKNNCFRVSIVNDCIAATAQTNAATFTIARQSNGTYTVRSKSGYYIGAEQADSASMSTKKTTALYNRIYWESDTSTKVVIQAAMTNGYVLRYNADPTSNRFRYYAVGKKKGIHLYKLTDGTAVSNTAASEGKIIDGRLLYLPEGFYIKDGKLYRRTR